MTIYSVSVMYGSYGFDSESNVHLFKTKELADEYISKQHDLVKDEYDDYESFTRGDEIVHAYSNDDMFAEYVLKEHIL